MKEHIKHIDRFFNISKNIIKKFVSFLLPVVLLLLTLTCVNKQQIVTEGNKNLLIEKITFYGNKSIKSNKLKKVMRIIQEGEPYNEYRIKVGLENILAYYRNKGFFNAQVTKQKANLDVDTRRIELYFTIDEGKRSIIKSITFEGNKVIKNKQLRKAIIIHTKDPYDYYRIFTSRYNIASLYARNGYIYAEVTTSPIDSFLINKNLIFHINEGRKVYVKDVQIEGNRKVRKQIIEREILLKPGGIYSPQKVYDSQQKIYATGLFDDVKATIIGVKEKRDSVTVLFKVLEGKTKWIVLGAAFQTPNRISTNAGWGHENLFNNNQSLSLNYTYTFNLVNEELGDLNINYTEPYLFSTRLRFSLHLFNDRERTIKESNSVYFSNIYGINSRISHSINLFTDITSELKFKKTFINVTGDYEPEKNIITNSVLLSYSQDTRDNIFNPRKGILVLTSMELAGTVLKGDNHFLRYTIDLSLYRRFTKRSIIASKFKVGYTIPLLTSTANSISVDERFELGGPSSLRGYNMSSIGASDIRGKRSGIYLINGGEEFRFPIYKMFGGAAFFDWGGLWLNKTNISLKNIKTGIGFGIRYNTIIGPIRLDYGYRLTDRTENYKGNIYFAIGNAF